MKNTFILAVLSIFPSLASCQTSSLPNWNFPTDGDSYCMYRIISSELYDSVLKDTIDLRNMDIASDSIVIRYENLGTDSSSFIKSSPHGLSQYEINGNNLYITKSETRNNSLRYDLPIQVATFPFQYGDSLSGLFFAKGRYCEEIPYLVVGKYNTVISECPNIILPEGDTLQNVCRVDQYCMSACVWTADFDKLKEQETFSGDSIILFLSNATALQHNIVSRWYVEGYKHPMLEVERNDITEEGENVFRQLISYYAPINTAVASNLTTNPMLSYKSDNSLYRYKENVAFNSLNIHSLNKGQLIATLLGTKAEDEKVYPFVICNTDGTDILHGECKFDEGGQPKIIVGSLHPGVYLLGIYVYGRWIVQKFIMK